MLSARTATLSIVSARWEHVWIAAVVRLANQSFQERSSPKKSLTLLKYFGNDRVATFSPTTFPTRPTLVLPSLFQSSLHSSSDGLVKVRRQLFKLLKRHFHAVKPTAPLPCENTWYADMSAQRACFLSQTLMERETERRHNTASQKLHKQNYTAILQPRIGSYGHIRTAPLQHAAIVPGTPHACRRWRRLGFSRQLAHGPSSHFYNSGPQQSDTPPDRRSAIRRTVCTRNTRTATQC